MGSSQCCGGKKIKSNNCGCNENPNPGICFNSLNCNAEFYDQPCNSEQGLKNWAIVKMLYKWACCLKDNFDYKETTYKKQLQDYNGNPPLVVNPEKAIPRKGDIHIDEYPNDAFLTYVYDGAKWVLVYKSGSGSKARRFYANLGEDTTVDTLLDMTGRTWKNFDVFYNGQKIYCKEEQSTGVSGNYVWDLGGDGVYRHYYSKNGFGMPGDPAPFGDNQILGYLEIIEK